MNPPFPSFGWDRIGSNPEGGGKGGRCSEDSSGGETRLQCPPFRGRWESNSDVETEGASRTARFDVGSVACASIDTHQRVHGQGEGQGAETGVERMPPRS